MAFKILGVLLLVIVGSLLMAYRTRWLIGKVMGDDDDSDSRGDKS